MDFQNNKNIFCRKCGKQIPFDSEFCTYCGEKVLVQTPQASGIDCDDRKNVKKPTYQSISNTDTDKIKTIIIVILLIAAVAYGGWLYLITSELFYAIIFPLGILMFTWNTCSHISHGNIGKGIYSGVVTALSLGMEIVFIFMTYIE